eukprot:scpid113227/ scgid23263/ 
MPSDAPAMRCAFCTRHKLYAINQERFTCRYRSRQRDKKSVFCSVWKCARHVFDCMNLTWLSLFLDGVPYSALLCMTACIDLLAGLFTSLVFFSVYRQSIMQVCRVMTP